MEPPYRVQIATTATAGIRGLREEEWAPLRRQLALVATLAATRPPPPKDVLEAGGLSPPLFRLREGSWLLLYDISALERTVTVLHVLKISLDTPEPVVGAWPKPTRPAA